MSRSDPELTPRSADVVDVASCLSPRVERSVQGIVSPTTNLHHHRQSLVIHLASSLIRTEDQLTMLYDNAVLGMPKSTTHNQK